MKACMVPLLLSGCIMEVDVGGNDRPGDRPAPDPQDLDNDGYTADEGDCDDNDPDMGPAGWDSEFDEQCDGIDNNCSGQVDEGVCQRLDIFVQKQQLDVLFVVDTSFSMATYIARATDGASDFLTHVVGPAFDTHIGVVTMDASDPDTMGELVTVDDRQFIVGNDPTLTGEAARTWLTRALSENGTLTGIEPSGRAAVDAAVTSHGDTDWNLGFLRPGAALTLVFLSDSEDATVTPTVEGLLDTLADLKGPYLTNVTVHAIAQLDELDCAGVPSSETWGLSYVALVESTLGTSLSVCEVDYGPYLSAVGQMVATEGLGDTFVLSSPAQNGTVEVTVTLPGGAEVELGSDAIFLAGDNRTLGLITDPLPPPPAGSVLNVSYLAQYQ